MKSGIMVLNNPLSIPVIENDKTLKQSQLENGVDLGYIQEFLGHKHLKSTGIYTNASTKNIGKIKSPSDKFKLGGR